MAAQILSAPARLRRLLKEDGLLIAHRQRGCVAAACAHTLDVSAARLDPHEIVAEVLELVANTLRSAFPDRHSADEGCDADGDA